MMVLDHVDNQEAMVYAQLGQQPLARTTETSLEHWSGARGLSLLFERAASCSCFLDGDTAPRVVTVCPREHCPVCVYSKCAAAALADLRARVMDDRTFSPFFEHTIAVPVELAINSSQHYNQH